VLMEAVPAAAADEANSCRHGWLVLCACWEGGCALQGFVEEAGGGAGIPTCMGAGGSALAAAGNPPLVGVSGALCCLDCGHCCRDCRNQQAGGCWQRWPVSNGDV